MRSDGDSVLFAVDVDEACAKEVVESWVPRLARLNPRKPIGICLFVREFEAYFLACLDLIAADYPKFGWSLDDWDLTDNHEQPRGAKERISRFMKKGRAYKPTSNQAGFVSALDHDRLTERCRSFRHLTKALEWLRGDDDADRVFPILGNAGTQTP